MIKIQYEKTSFKEPEQINDKTFLILKEELTQNPNYILDEYSESFIEKYKTNFKYIAIAIIVIFLGEFLKSDFLEIVAGFVILAFVGNMFLEGRSYATFLKEKTKYFELMTYAISTSNNYLSYKMKIENLKTKKNNTLEEYKRWNKIRKGNYKINMTSLDNLLITTFHIINKHGVTIFIILFILLIIIANL